MCKPVGDRGRADGKTLGVVLGVGSPTESIFQLTIDDRAAGVTGTGQQPDSPATLVKSFPVPNVVPFEINIVKFFTQNIVQLLAFLELGRKSLVSQQFFRTLNLRAAERLVT